MKTGGTRDRDPSAVFHAITHVWGREYLDVFLRWCIPNQLAPGNVPALPPGSRYRILTGSRHVDELRAHPMVGALRGVIPVDLVEVDALDDTEHARGHDLMIACHRQAVADAVEANAALIFLSADFIFSNNALAAVVGRHRDGFRAVANTGLRLAKESFVHALEAAGPRATSLPPRDLVQMALPHLHPHTRSMFADARPASRFPVAVYWRVADEGLLARCLHLHPLMVDPMNRLLPKGTIDGRYLVRACPDLSRVHVVDDSDELQMFELTPAKRTVVPAGGARVSAWRVAAVAAACDVLQVRYWRSHAVRLHTAEISERWAAAAIAADAFVQRVAQVQRYGQFVRRWFLFQERLRQRRDRYRRAWKRGHRRVTLKQVLRPVRIAASRSGKKVRKTTRHWRRRAGEA